MILDVSTSRRRKCLTFVSEPATMSKRGAWNVTMIEKKIARKDDIDSVDKVTMARKVVLGIKDSDPPFGAMQPVRVK